jgi:hypothetical protein
MIQANVNQKFPGHNDAPSLTPYEFKSLEDQILEADKLIETLRDINENKNKRSNIKYLI